MTNREAVSRMSLVGLRLCARVTLLGVVSACAASPAEGLGTTSARENPGGETAGVVSGETSASYAASDPALTDTATINTAAIDTAASRAEASGAEATADELAEALLDAGPAGSTQEAANGETTAPPCGLEDSEDVALTKLDEVVQKAVTSAQPGSLSIWLSVSDRGQVYCVSEEVRAVGGEPTAAHVAIKQVHATVPVDKVMHLARLRAVKQVGFVEDTVVPEPESP